MYLPRGVSWTTLLAIISTASIIPLNPIFKEENIDTNAFSDCDCDDDDDVIGIFERLFLGTDDSALEEEVVKEVEKKEEVEDGAVEEVVKEVDEVEGGVGFDVVADMFPTVSWAIIANAHEGLTTKFGSSSEKEKRYSCIERTICSCSYIRIDT